MEVEAAIGGGGGGGGGSSLCRVSSSSSIQPSSTTITGRRGGSFSSGSAASSKLIHHCPHHQQHRHLSSSQPVSHLFSSYQLSSPYNATRTHHKTPPHLYPSLGRFPGTEQTEATYIMIKPDGVQRGLVGEIISRFENKGFKLTGLKLYQCPKVLAMEHYKDLSSKPFFPKLMDYITSGPVVCMAWEGIGVVASARKLIGATNPLLAEPGTIRGDLAVQTGRNVVHGSDSPENGQREIALWFKEGELCDWTPVQAPWLTE